MLLYADGKYLQKQTFVSSVVYLGYLSPILRVSQFHT